MQNSVTTEPVGNLGSEWRGLNKWAELYDLLAPHPVNHETLLDIREQFARSGYVKLPSFLSPAALTLFRSEMEELEQIAIRRQFEMPGYETPRSLSVLGGTTIRTKSPLLYSMYHHSALRGTIESIIGRPVFTCTHPEEFIVANFLHNSGDTHGWHLDDPSYALIIFAEAPSEDGGGVVEFIANWPDLCRRKGHKPNENVAELVSWADENGLIDRHTHKAGDAYLLRADLNLHRVTPLKKEGERRAAVNLAFQVSADVDYGITADLLYGY